MIEGSVVVNAGSGTPASETTPVGQLIGSASVDVGMAGSGIALPSASGQIFGQATVNVVGDCGITDTFTRTVSNGWGTCDAGIAWQNLISSGTSAGFNVDGSQGIIGEDRGYELISNLPISSHPATLDASIDLHLNRDLFVHSPSPSEYIDIAPGYGDISGPPVMLNVINFGGSQLFSLLDGMGGGVNAVPSIDLTQPFRVRFVWSSGNNMNIYVWQLTDVEPSTPLLSAPIASTFVPDRYDIEVECLYGPDWGIPYLYVYFDNLNIVGVNRCTV
jgi:hypothetical protein